MCFVEHSPRVDGRKAPLPGLSQVDFPGSWRWNGLIHPLCQNLGVLPLSRGREGKCIHEATLGERLPVREDRSRSRSHRPRRPGAPVSIAMVPCGGKGWAVPGLRRNPGLVFPVLELPGPDSPATALRSRGNPNGPSREVGSWLCAPQPSSRPARLHGNVPGSATAVAKGQSRRIRRLPGFAHQARPTPLVPPSLRVSQATRRAAHRVCAGAHSASARAQKTMDPERAPVPELLAKAEDENSAAGQQLRPLVTWNLDSPIAGRVAPQATTSSGTYPASAFFQHSRLRNRRDTHVRSQPKICFLQPRTAQPLVLFRCGPGTQSILQSPDPRGSRTPSDFCSLRQLRESWSCLFRTLGASEPGLFLDSRRV